MINKTHISVDIFLLTLGTQCNLYFIGCAREIVLVAFRSSIFTSYLFPYVTLQFSFVFHIIREKEHYCCVVM